MYIQNEKTHTQRLHDGNIMPDGYDVSFNDDGVAQAKEGVAQALIDKYDTITEYNNE